MSCIYVWRSYFSDDSTREYKSINTRYLNILKRALQLGIYITLSLELERNHGSLWNLNIFDFQNKRVYIFIYIADFGPVFQAVNKTWNLFKAHIGTVNDTVENRAFGDQRVNADSSFCFLKYLKNNYTDFNDDCK